VQDLLFSFTLYFDKRGIFFSPYLVKPLTFVPKHNSLSFTYVQIGLKSVKHHSSVDKWNLYRTEPSECLCALTLELWTPGEVIIICTIDLSLVNILIVLIKEAVGIKGVWSCLCHFKREIRV
jgi:hypothetical protein